MANPKAPTWRPWRGAHVNGESIWFGDVAVEVNERPDGASFCTEWSTYGHTWPNISSAKRVAIDAVRAMLREAAEALEAYEMAEKETER